MVLIVGLLVATVTSASAQPSAAAPVPAAAPAPAGNPYARSERDHRFRLGFVAAVAVATVAGGSAVFGLGVVASDADARDSAIATWNERTGGVLARDDQCADAASWLRSQMPPERDLLASIVSRCDDHDRHSLITNVMLVTTVVAVGSAVYLYYEGFIVPRRRVARAAALTPIVTPTLAGAELRISF